MSQRYIFVSAVTNEFARGFDGRADDPNSFRALLCRALVGPHTTVHVQSTLIERGIPTLAKIDQYIRKCKLVIQVVGDMTGERPRLRDVKGILRRHPELVEDLSGIRAPLQGGTASPFSYTQWEAYLAVFYRIPLLLAVPAPGALHEMPLSEGEEKSRREHDERLRASCRCPACMAAQKESQAEYIERLRANSIYTIMFANLEHLESKIKDVLLALDSEEPRSRAMAVSALFYDFTMLPSTELERLTSEQLTQIHDAIDSSIRQVAPTARGTGYGKGGRYIVETIRGEGLTRMVERRTRIVDLASVALKTAKEFQTKLEHFGVTKWKGVWDIRFVITAAEVYKLQWGDSDRVADDYVGIELDIAARWLLRMGSGEIAVINAEIDDEAELTKKGFCAVTDNRLGNDRKDLSAIGIFSTREQYETASDDDKNDERLFHYQRSWDPAPHDPIAISTATIQRLSRSLLAGAKAEELAYHSLPINYGVIRQALLERSLVLLVGDAGVGKSLCALRLVAELMQQDRRAPRLPRVAESAWDYINDAGPMRSVFLLDDAFGKSFVRRGDYLLKAKLALRRFLGVEEEADDDAGEASTAEMGRASLVIITVRPEIWKDVKRDWRKEGPGSDEEFEALIEARHIFHLQEGAYGDLAVLFEKLAKYGKERPRSGDLTVLPSVAKHVGRKLKHPMSVTDCFHEFRQHGFGLTEKQIKAAVVRYQGKPKDRYLDELAESLASTECGLGEFSEFGFFFFMQVFGNALLRRDQLETLFYALTVEAELLRPWDGEDAGDVWKRHMSRVERWGKWSDYGHFTASHPLREEALGEFFASPKAASAIEQIFAAFPRITSVFNPPDVIWRAAAFAVPHVGGRLGVFRKAIVDAAVDGKSPEARSSAITLANAIGHALSADCDHPTLRLLGPELRQHLTDALRRLMENGGTAAAAAAAAVCDSYREADGNVAGSSGNEPLDLIRLVCDVAEIRNRDVKEYIAWAVASNFVKLPNDLRNMLITLARDEDEWVRLRSLEAIADYYGDLKDIERVKGFRPQLDAALLDGANHVNPVIRRGVAAALEDNYEEIDSAQGWLLNMAKNMTSIGALEWVIWSIGSWLDDLVSKKTDNTIQVLTRLALHEDARVRVWVARELAAKPKVLEKQPRLADLLSRLADDPNEEVWNAASRVFFHSDDE